MVHHYSKYSQTANHQRMAAPVRCRSDGEADDHIFPEWLEMTEPLLSNHKRSIFVNT